MNYGAAIITGATRGIGRSTALLLAQKGYRIVAVGRSMDDLTRLSDELKAEGHNSLCIQADVSEEAGAMMVVQQAIDAFGNISLLVNNAGIGVFKKAEEIELTDWQWVMDVNLKGNFLMTKAVLPLMKKQKHGHIIAVASDVAKRTFETGSLYCASKYAQDAFCSALRKEVRADGIKVSVVYPGLVDTFFHVEGPGTERAKSWLRPEDVAEAIAYIAMSPKHVVIDELMIHPLSQEY